MGAWQSFIERKTLREASERLQPPISAIQKGDNAVMHFERCQLWEPVEGCPSDHFDAGFGDSAQQPHSSYQQGNDQSRSSASFALTGTGAW